jgi:hypothetical protein
VENASVVEQALIRLITTQEDKQSLWIYVNDISCSYPTMMELPKATQFVSDFECKNVINATGNYTISFYNIGSAKDLSDVRIYAIITYVTPPIDIGLDVWKQFFALGTPPEMSSTEYYCENDTILVKNRTIEVCEKGKCENVIGVERIKCDWGCANSECRQPPWITYAIIFGLVIVASVVYILIAHSR